MSRSFHGKQSTCCAPLDKWTRWLLQVHQVRQGLTLLQQRQVRQRRLRQPRHPRTLQAVRPQRRRLRRRTQRRKMNCQGRAHASRTLSAECRLTKRFVALFGRNRCPRQPVALCPRVRTRSLRLLLVMRQLPVLRQLRVLRLPPVLRRLPLRPQASNGSRPKRCVLDAARASILALSASNSGFPLRHDRARIFGSRFGNWCNGSTTDSDSVCLGSNPRFPV